MTPEAVRTHVLDALHAIAPDADPAGLAPDAELRTALDIDSFDFLQLLLALKRRLGVEIPDAEAGQLKTLDQIVAWLLPRIPATGAGAAAAPEPRPAGGVRGAGGAR